jgi:hypothetical protein
MQRAAEILKGQSISFQCLVSSLPGHLRSSLSLNLSSSSNRRLDLPSRLSFSTNRRTKGFSNSHKFNRQLLL